MDPVLVPAMAVGLIAAYPGWLMLQKVYFTAKWQIPSALLCLLLAGGFAYSFFHLPFWLAQGKQVQAYDMFVDMIIYAACPLGLIALIAYVLDHLSERTMRSVVCGAACLAIAALPIMYYFMANDMHARFEMSTEPTTTVPAEQSTVIPAVQNTGIPAEQSDDVPVEQDANVDG